MPKKSTVGLYFSSELLTFAKLDPENSPTFWQTSHTDLACQPHTQLHIVISTDYFSIQTFQLQDKLKKKELSHYIHHLIEHKKPFYFCYKKVGDTFILLSVKKKDIQHIYECSANFAKPVSIEIAAFALIRLLPKTKAPQSIMINDSVYTFSAYRLINYANGAQETLSIEDLKKQTGLTENSLAELCAFAAALRK